LPRYPVELGDNPALQTVAKREKRVLLHEEIMDCVIGDPNCKTKEYICCEHEYEVVEKDKTFTFNGKKNTKVPTYCSCWCWYEVVSCTIANV